jgi:uncharacterized caspase-like protein
VSVIRVGICAAVFLVASAFAALAYAPKLALVITNKAYPASIGVLENTHRDGERMAAALMALGFAVVHRRDLDKAATVAAMADYVERLERAGPEAVGFFYYAGHGAANSKYGDNYLIPIDAPIASDSQLALQAVKVGEIIDSIAATSAKTNFLVFDACRNVPMSFSVRSATRGLRAEGHRQGMLIAFATDPGKTATDEGVYAEALAEEMKKPGVLATEVFRAVRSRVLAATEQRQFPWIEDGLIDNMYFQPQKESVSPGSPPVQPAQTPAPEEATSTNTTALPLKTLPAKPTDALPLRELTLTATLSAGQANKNAGSLGLQISVLKSPFISAFGSKAKEGALVLMTADGGPAATAGVRALDLITAIDGEPVESPRKLAELVSRKRPGEKIKVRLWRLADNRSILIERLSKRAELNDLGAIKLLAALNTKAYGGPQDEQEALQLYRKAAALGDAEAIYNLGLMHISGNVVREDRSEAVRLWRKAAELGNPEAMYDLARMYDRGQVLAQDRGKAAELVISAIKKRSENALQRAQFDDWSEVFRRELQQLLRQEGVYAGSIDGKANEALRSAVLALAAKSKGGG